MVIDILETIFSTPFLVYDLFYFIFTGTAKRTFRNAPRFMKVIIRHSDNIARKL